MGDRKYQGPWPTTRRTTTNLYPGLTVADGVQTGSIVFDKSRLAVWAIVWDVIRDGWDAATDWYDYRGDWTEDDFARFVHSLCQLRGEFGRLILELAEAERCDSVLGMSRPAWWERKTRRDRVRRQLQRCLDALNEEAADQRTTQ